MSAFVWLSPDNTQTYETSIVNDPIPLGLGYTLTSGSDGAPDAALKTYTGGLASGGYPQYSGYGNNEGLGPNPNGILK